MTPGQAKFMYWFVGTAPILKAMTSITTYWGLKDEAIKKIKNTTGEVVKKLPPEAARTVYLGVLSDFARQTVTCSFQLLSYFIVGDAIKGILNKIAAKKPPEQQDPGLQQVLKQTIPLGVQVLATIFSRKMGAAQLESLFKPDANGELVIPEKEKGWSLWFKKHTKPLVENTLTETVTINGKAVKSFQPLKASLMATSGMVGYFTVLVGLLYGTSTLLEKTFPGTFKSKQPGSDKEQGKDQPDATQNPAPAAARLDVNSAPLSQPTAQPATQPAAHSWPFQRPLTTFTGRPSVFPMQFSHS